MNKEELTKEINEINKKINKKKAIRNLNITYTLIYTFIVGLGYKFLLEGITHPIITFISATNAAKAANCGLNLHYDCLNLKELNEEHKKLKIMEKSFTE